MDQFPDADTQADQQPETISVLLIEDDEDDYLLTREYFEQFDAPDDYELTWSCEFDAGLRALVGDDHDICLLDYRLGAEDGIELLRRARSQDCNAPIVFLTGAGNRRVDRKAMEYGATDYLVKSEITAGLLERTLRYSLERHRFAQRQRRLAEENQRLYREAQRALELRDEMQSIVAHDLKNPLNSMSLALQLMERHLDNDADPEAFARQLDTQRTCISQMKGLIQDLLEVSRIEDGSLSLDRGTYLPDQLVEIAVEQHGLQAQDQSIELTVDLEADLPFVDADARRIEQVFANLIGNAIKFTSAGGSIQISAKAQAETVQFSVRDTGRGISEEKLTNLFERFWQDDHQEGRGAGLGLAICKGLVEAHGGEIWAESIPEEGSTFHFTIPTASDTGR